MKLFNQIKRQPSVKAFKRLLQVVSGVGVCLLVATVWSSRFLPAVAQYETYEVKSVPGNVIWGELFKPDSEPILTVKSGDRIRMETVSHEGILADQGDTVEFLTGGGIKADDILPDQIIIKGTVPKSGPGPHVITGPIYVEDAEPGDVLEIKTIAIDYRVPYGVISNR
ncbi:MAG: hypothetical protein WBB18_16330, partial [Nodosilinea sp.]